jgi:tetratricopeptide (TPR) repeat protein
LGIGVGLFARYFLDWFRHLCAREGRAYYDRLCYVAADISPRMLEDARLRGVFDGHPGRYRLRPADALCPERTLLADHDIAGSGPRPFRAAFLNYLLGCLPAAVVRSRQGGAEILHARTSLPPPAEWAGNFPAHPDEVRRLAASPRPEDRRELLPLYPLMQAEYQYRPAGGQLPYEEFALRQAGAAGGRLVLHSHGALGCLQSLLALLADGGVVLINDYGQAAEVASDRFEHQRFSRSTAAGVNFPLLRQFFDGEAGACWREPPGAESGLHSRLLTRRPPAAAVAARFDRCYGEEAREWLEEPARRAREMAGAGRLREALSGYREAIARQPFNWALMNEAAHFLAITAGDPSAGLELVRAALRHNPACSPGLWSLGGDCYFLTGRPKEARAAYERALSVSGDDVRARYGLAFVHADTGDYRSALVCLAEALALDHGGAYRERLLQKQAEILALLARHNQSRHRGEANRVAGPGTGRPSG